MTFDYPRPWLTHYFGSVLWAHGLVLLLSCLSPRPLCISPRLISFGPRPCPLSNLINLSLGPRPLLAIPHGLVPLSSRSEHPLLSACLCWAVHSLSSLLSVQFDCTVHRSTLKQPPLMTFDYPRPWLTHYSSLLPFRCQLIAVGTALPSALHFICCIHRSILLVSFKSA